LGPRSGAGIVPAAPPPGDDQLAVPDGVVVPCAQHVHDFSASPMELESESSAAGVPPVVIEHRFIPPNNTCFRSLVSLRLPPSPSPVSLCLSVQDLERIPSKTTAG
jgi:hypothetical protein